MKIKNLHDWNVDYGEAVRIQKDLVKKLILRDVDSSLRVETIAGADVSYSRGSDRFFASVVLLEFSTMKVIEKSSFAEIVKFPYIPGLLTFREGPPLLNAFLGLKNTPDVVIFDGQGIAHPRGIGLASHMGLFLDVPTIGCAKTRLAGTYEDVGNNPGDRSALIYDGRTIGNVLRTKKNVKPVFVSQGHKIGLQKSVEISLASCRGYRLPEPVRIAHLTVNEARTGYSQSPLK
jgi:deoxyribonuclease V